MRTQHLLFVNLDDNDFVRAYFLERHLIKHCAARGVRLTVLSVGARAQVQRELAGARLAAFASYFSHEAAPPSSISVRHTTRAALPAELDRVTAAGTFSAILFNALDPLVLGFLRSMRPSVREAVTAIYDPHKLARMDGVAAGTAEASLCARTLLFTDAQQHARYHAFGFAPGNVHRVALALDEDYFAVIRAITPAGRTLSVFSGGDTDRDYPLLAEAVAATVRSVLVISSRDTSTLTPILSLPYVPYWRYHVFMSTARLVAIPLAGTAGDAGVTNVVAAFALGKPVLITETPVTSDYVSAGRNGWLFHSAAAARDRIQALLADRDLYERLARCAHETFLQRHTMSTLVERVMGGIGAASPP